MSKKKWLLIVAVGMAAVCGTAIAIVLVVLFVVPGMFVDNFLPVYTTEQTASTHPGYRHTTLSSGNAIYVNDYDEYSLLLINREPTQAVGRYGAGKVCAIPGQKADAYLAADVGSEMPAYEVFRNSQIPPFDWRHATFQAMQFAIPTGPAANKRATDPALIADVVRTLNEGTPATPQPPPGNTSNVFGLYLYSDQLPGLIFNPSVYMDEAGPVYLAENVLIETSNSRQSFQARWILASPRFTQWVKTR